MSNVLHLLCSTPDEIVTELISILGNGKETRVICLYPDEFSDGSIDWNRVLEDIMAHETTICWW